MSDCVNKFFLYNGEVKYCEEFQSFYPKSGKVLYEVIRIVNKAPLFLKEHIKRLENSIALTKENIVISSKDIRSGIEKLIEINEVHNGNVKIIITEELTVIYSVKHSYPTEEMYKEGVKVILYFGERENPNAKVINNNFREKVNEKVNEAKAYEAILINNEGYITEGSKSNIFMIKDKYIYTSPVDKVLPGITREKIIEACKRVGLEVLEQSISYKDISSLDGMFISGTSPKVLPIREVEEVKVFSSENNILKGIMKEFDELINEDINNIS
jgi:branched-chain amino acid aminotransferase